MTSYKIEVEGLRKQFGDLVVLRDINLKVEEGAVIALIGPSGSGKSTLLRCLNLLVAPEGGRVRVGDDVLHVPGQEQPAQHPRAGALPLQHGHGVPALQPIPAYERAAKRHGRPGRRQEDAEGRRPRSWRASSSTRSD